MKHLIKLDSELRRVLKKRPELTFNDPHITTLRWMTPSTMDWIDEMISIGFTPRKMTHYLNALVDDQRKLIVKLSYFVNSFQVKPKRRVPTLLLSQSCGRQCLIMQPFVDTNLSKEQVDLINGFLTNKDLLKEAVSLYGGDPEVRNIGHINGELVAFDW